MKKIALFAFAAAGVSSFAQSYSEGFDSVSGLGLSGWAQQNLSESAVNQGPFGGWFQGNDHSGVTGGVNTSSDFPAFSGGTDSYIGTIFAVSNSGTGTTLSNWLFTPTATLNNGDTFSFYTRTNTFGGSTIYPDRLEVRLSTNGSSTNVGATSTSVGDFTNLLLTVNPSLNTVDYPTTWTQYNLTVSGLAGPTSGRFAFRYFVTDGGPAGANSGRIGIDDVSYTAVPEPGTLAVLGLGLLAARKRRK